MGLGRFPCAGGRHGARADPAFRSGPRGMHLLHAMLPAQLYCVMCCGVLSGCLLSRQLDAQCRASSAPLRDLLDAPTALAACCGFDLCHKYILYLYLYSSVLDITPRAIVLTDWGRCVNRRTYVQRTRFMASWRRC